MINIDINNQILQIVTACVLLLLIIYFIYICFKGHKSEKEDKKEILDIMCSLEEKKHQIENIEEIESQKEYEEVKEVEVVENKSEIEEMLEKMQHDLEAKSEDVVENFEKEQEEKSIISYQELLKSLNKEKQVAKVENTKVEVAVPKQEERYEIDTEEQDLIDAIDFKTPHRSERQIDLESHKIEESPIIPIEKEENKATKKFKNTDFISPIYGKMEEHFDYPKVPSFQPKEQIEFDFDRAIQNDMVEETIEEIDRKFESHNIDDYLEDFDFHGHMKIDSLEQTLDMPPISPEVKANEDFLQALKEFRKNLE